MSKNQGSERCPACGSRMFPGDVVCRACERRVKAARPDIIGDYANRDITDVKRGDFLRGQLTLFAVRLAPARGRPVNPSPLTSNTTP